MAELKNQITIEDQTYQFFNDDVAQKSGISVEKANELIQKLLNSKTKNEAKSVKNPFYSEELSYNRFESAREKLVESLPEKLEKKDVEYDPSELKTRPIVYEKNGKEEKFSLVVEVPDGSSKTDNADYFKMMTDLNKIVDEINLKIKKFKSEPKLEDKLNLKNDIVYLLDHELPAAFDSKKNKLPREVKDRIEQLKTDLKLPKQVKDANKREQTGAPNTTEIKQQTVQPSDFEFLSNSEVGVTNQIDTGSEKQYFDVGMENYLTIPQIDKAIANFNKIISQYQNEGDSVSAQRFIALRTRFMNARTKINNYYNKAKAKNPALTTPKNKMTVAMLKGGKFNAATRFLSSMGRRVGATIDAIEDHRGLIIATTAVTSTLLATSEIITQIPGAKEAIESAVKSFFANYPLAAAAVCVAAIGTTLALLPNIKNKITTGQAKAAARKYNKEEALKGVTEQRDEQEDKLVQAIKEGKVGDKSAFKDKNLLNEIYGSRQVQAWIQSIARDPSYNAHERAYAIALLDTANAYGMEQEVAIQEQRKEAAQRKATAQQKAEQARKEADEVAQKS